ncbi:uncharacterized protein TNCV_3628291 [Trichonephila clavipes]|nr:uncharacterized protein TNCV_3628291 [Trichonephila clavipes]
MVSSVVVVFGRPGRSSSPKLLRPRLNSAAQTFIVVNDDAESPYTESTSSLICVGVLPFKNKYLMTARYTILSIFTKTLTSTPSNDCYITSARPRWLNLLSSDLFSVWFGNHQARRRFIELAQNEIAVVPDFHKRILFSDEAHFWLNGYVSKQNCRIWSEANAQVYVETPLHPEKLTVWCALWAGGILLQKR